MLKKILIIITLILLLKISITYIASDNSGEFSPYNNLCNALCDRKSYYTSGSFRDYTDYCEYYFNSHSVQNYIKNSECKIVTQYDIENIKNYFDNFEEWLKWCDYKDKYTFDKDTQIKEGDYFYIDAPSGYGNYNVYYVDIEKNIVYFIHNNFTKTFD